MKIIIVAGGGGTRLWPLSRKQKPKQFQQLIGEKTMLQLSFERLLDTFSVNDIYISSNKNYTQSIQKQLPELDPSHIISEPERKETGPAIGFSSIIASNDDDETLVFLSADHIIQKPEVLCTLLQKADQFVSDFPEYIVTLGILPDHPHTGYGYIQYDQELTSYDDITVKKVKSFVEKPDLETAQNYIQDGHYLWNAGMFIVKRGTLHSLFKQYLPETFDILKTIEQAKGTTELDFIIHQEYPKMQKITIDYGIMERAEHVAVIPANIGWNDVGSWSVIKDILSKKSQDHVVRGNHKDISSDGLLVYADSGKMIATIGLSDIVIIDTEDVTLICAKDKAQDVKKIVDMLEKEGSHLL